MFGLFPKLNLEHFTFNLKQHTLSRQTRVPGRSGPKTAETFGFRRTVEVWNFGTFSFLRISIVRKSREFL